MEEIWVDIKGYEGFYQVSNLGRVRSLEREIIKSNNIKQISKSHILNFEKRKGYNYVHLSKNGIRKRMAVHRLVAEAFIPNTESKPFIDHINTIRDDNRVENLHWVTPKENMNNPLTKEKLNGNPGKRGRPKGSLDKKPRNKKSNGNKKSNEMAQETKDKIGKANSIKVVQLDKNTNELIKIWNSAKEAEREYGFDNGNINRCCRGKYKTHKGYKWMYYEDYIKLN